MASMYSPVSNIFDFFKYRTTPYVNMWPYTAGCAQTSLDGINHLLYDGIRGWTHYCFHTAGATGSIPVPPTRKSPQIRQLQRTSVTRPALGTKVVCLFRPHTELQDEGPRLLIL